MILQYEINFPGSSINEKRVVQCQPWFVRGTTFVKKNSCLVARTVSFDTVRIFSFHSYVYYLTRGLIASTRAFNLQTHAFNLPTRAFNLGTRVFSLLTRGWI